MSDYLKGAGFLTERERALLRQTGAPSPLALESTLRANTQYYERVLGKSRLQALLAALGSMITSEERNALKDVPSGDYPLGVDIDHAPARVTRTPVHEERDRIYHELQRLRSRGDQSPQAKERMRLLEEQLIKLVEEANRAA